MLQRSIPSALALFAVAAIASVSTGTAQEPTAPARFETALLPQLQRYCLDCHSTRRHKGDLDLERFASLDDVARAPTLWRDVREKLEAHDMPPDDAEHELPDAERAQMTSWIATALDALARANAGDPGPVVLRRLSNAEYSWTIRDLTGLAALDPTREFPIDGAAGEGFTNVGNALVVSSALLGKYMDAGKQITEHAVLLPDGVEFWPETTRRDRTEAILARIRSLYARHTEATGGEMVDLQGIRFATNDGGRLPLAGHLAACLELRDVPAGDPRIAELARERGLSAKYLGLLHRRLHDDEPSLLLDPLRARFAQATQSDLAALEAEIAAWQKSLWKLNSVGHIGKANGPRSWLESVDPLAESEEIRVPVVPATGADEVLLHLETRAVLVEGTGELARWRNARFVAAGRPDLPLREIRPLAAHRIARRDRALAQAGAALRFASEVASRETDPMRLDLLAVDAGLEIQVARRWLRLLGLRADGGDRDVQLFTDPLPVDPAHPTLAGFGAPATPLVVANPSAETQLVPGEMHAHSVALHPSPTLRATATWCSPITTTARIGARVRHAHLACGNGVLWSLELRRGSLRIELAKGAARDGTPQLVDGLGPYALRTGDRLVLGIAADRDHTCDLTAVDLTVTGDGGALQTWDLARDCADDLQAGNPHADRLGHGGVWRFGAEPDDAVRGIAATSSLSRFVLDPDPAQRALQIAPVLELLGPRVPVLDAEREARALLLDLDGPLTEDRPEDQSDATATTLLGLDGAEFDGDDLRVLATGTLAIHLPASLVAGREFVAIATPTGDGACVQMRASPTPPSRSDGPLPAEARPVANTGPWTSSGTHLDLARPILAASGSPVRARLHEAFDAFRALFPPALCYARIVPVDEVVTLTQFYREDDRLKELMLDAAESIELDRAWDQLHFVSQDPLTQVDAFEQIWQFATQDADPSVFEPLREPIRRRAAAFREQLAAAEPVHVEAVLRFAERAWRRPLTSEQQDELRALHARLLQDGLDHDAAIRTMLVRVLLAPAFLYHLERSQPGASSAPVDDFELASRLSYFLWSSLPDEELLRSAREGRLHEPAELAAQTRRMLKDGRVRRLAIEFGCAWLHIQRFDTDAEKSETLFPEFAAMRGAMYEESVRFLCDLFQRGGAVQELIDADHTFLDASLAAFYGIPGVQGDGWRRVDGVKRHGRGGVLAQAAVLAAQSGAGRTSPILRGNWLCEALLGEKLPRPPKNVPRLPEDESGQELTMREITERHTRDPACAKCHLRIDPFGCALEAYDAIGRRRDHDIGGRPIDTRVKFAGGTEIDGLDGLRQLLLGPRRDAFLRQFCRKLCGYALGRAVRLTDEPLLEQMRAKLIDEDGRIDVLFDAIVQSRQFREIRGKDAPRDD
ncbi:MAG: DUF1592 domain-containing protein [Planctomycetota bacterium]